MFVTAVINLGVVIPSSPGFIGTYQWLAVSALGVVGVDGDVAIAFSLLMQAVWFIPTMLVGGVIAIREVHREATRQRPEPERPSPFAWVIAMPDGSRASSLRRAERRRRARLSHSQRRG